MHALVGGFTGVRLRACIGQDDGTVMLEYSAHGTPRKKRVYSNDANAVRPDSSVAAEGEQGLSPPRPKLTAAEAYEAAWVPPRAWPARCCALSVAALNQRFSLTS